MLPKNVPATDDQRGPSSVSGTNLHVKGHLCGPTRHPRTLRDSPRRSVTTRTNPCRKFLRRYLTMWSVSAVWALSRRDLGVEVIEERRLDRLLEPQQHPNHIERLTLAVGHLGLLGI